MRCRRDRHRGRHRFQLSVLTLQGFTAGYGGSPRICDVDLTVHRGEVLAVLGPNGSGKSTLVKGILGLTEVLAGSVEAVPAAKIGYVPQRHTVGGGVASTVAEVVATGLLAHRPWWRRVGSADQVRIEHALAQVGLEKSANEDTSRMSGGQQRRVLIARALVGGPSLLIMDEPTAGVDAHNQRQLADTIATLARSGVAIIVVTHEVGPLLGTVDRALLLRDGHVEYLGDPDVIHLHHDGHHDPLPPTHSWTPDPRFPVSEVPTVPQHDHPHHHQPAHHQPVHHQNTQHPHPTDVRP